MCMKIAGFSMIELMVVLLVIAILAAFALPLNLPLTGRKQINHALEIPEAYKSKIRAYYRFHGKFPESNKELGIPQPDKLISTTVTSMTLEAGAMHVELGNKVLAELKGKIISVQPVVVPDSPGSPIDWVCAYAPAPEGMEKVGVNRTDVGKSFPPSACR
jgi:type IV pilus assembly protein PilA